jgi:hypothetical protein
MLVGTVDDGTHCNKDRGVCVLGVCQPMPKYFAPTKRPPTDSSGNGSWTTVASSKFSPSKRNLSSVLEMTMISAYVHLDHQISRTV